MYAFILKDMHIHNAKNHATISSVFFGERYLPLSENEAFGMHPKAALLAVGHGMRPRLRWPILRQGGGKSPGDLMRTFFGA